MSSRHIPVYYLHGWAGDPDDWSATIAPIQHDSALPWEHISLPLQEIYRESATLRISEPSLTDNPAFAAMLEALARRIDGRPFVIIGYSMGGRLASALVERFPATQVLGLGLVSSGPGFPIEAERELRRQQDYSRAERLRADPVQFWHEWYAQPVFGSPEAGQDWAALQIARGDTDIWSQMLIDLGQAEHADLMDIWGKQRQLLYVAGQADPKYCLFAENVARDFPKARTEIIPGVGHAILRQSPKPLARVISNWLRKVEELNL